MIALGALAISAAPAAAPASADDAAPSIVGGHDATQPYSWIASVQTVSPSTGLLRNYCDGALISADEVVTAEHCTDAFTAGVTTVRIGSNNWQAGGSTATIAKISHRPGFDGVSPGNDLAVLQLDHKVPEQPITISRNSAHVGDVGRIIGWGATCELGSPQWPCYPTALQEATVRIVRDAACSYYDPSVELCVRGAGGAMACFGDSGSPLFHWADGRWELDGVTSRDGDLDQSDPTCAGGTGIWTDLSHYRDWVDRQIDLDHVPVPGRAAPPHTTMPVQPAA